MLLTPEAIKQYRFTWLDKRQPTVERLQAANVIIDDFMYSSLHLLHRPLELHKRLAHVMQLPSIQERLIGMCNTSIAYHCLLSDLVDAGATETEVRTRMGQLISLWGLCACLVYTVRRTDYAQAAHRTQDFVDLTVLLKDWVHAYDIDALATPLQASNRRWDSTQKEIAWTVTASEVAGTVPSTMLYACQGLMDPDVSTGSSHASSLFASLTYALTQQYPGKPNQGSPLN